LAVDRSGALDERRRLEPWELVADNLQRHDRPIGVEHYRLLTQPL